MAGIIMGMALPVSSFMESRMLQAMGIMSKANGAASGINTEGTDAWFAIDTAVKAGA